MRLSDLFVSVNSGFMSICEVSCATIQDVTWQGGADYPYNDDLAVFRFRVVENEEVLPSLNQILQPDEQQRAERYYRDEDRQRFIYGRSLLRILCGHYTNQPPGDVHFTQGAHGKPELSGESGWHVNVSHSGEWILLAISRVSVGVDVEKIAQQFAFEEMLVSNFSQPEQAYCRRRESRRRFYALWTRKEALLKATGKGMDDAFQAVPSLDGLHQTNSALIGGSGNWKVYGFAVAADYPAAIAYQHTQEIPKFYTLNSVLLAS